MKGGPSPPRPTSLHGVWVSPEHPLGPASQPTAPPSPIVPCSMDKLLGLGPILSLLPPPTWLGGDLFVVGNPSLVWEEWGAGVPLPLDYHGWVGLEKARVAPLCFVLLRGLATVPVPSCPRDPVCHGLGTSPTSTCDLVPGQLCLAYRARDPISLSLCVFAVAQGHRGGGGGSFMVPSRLAGSWGSHPKARLPLAKATVPWHVDMSHVLGIDPSAKRVTQGRGSASHVPHPCGSWSSRQACHTAPCC